MFLNKDKILEKLKLRIDSKNNMGNKDKLSSDSQDTEISLEELYYEIEQLNTLWFIKDEKILISNRPIVGILITFIKKIIRKCLRWYIHPIAEQQTIFNSYNVKIVNKFKTYLEYQLKINEDNLNRNSEDFQKALNEMRTEFEITIEEVKENYENKMEVLNKLIDEAEQKNYKLIKNELIKYEDDEQKRIHHMYDLIKETKNPEIMENTIRYISDSYNKTTIEKEIIVIACEQYSKDGLFDAIKKEAYNTYCELKKSEIYSPVFISIEDDSRDIESEGDLIYLYKKDFLKYIYEINSYIVHIFSSNVHILFDEQMNVSKCNRIVFQCTGQEPFTDIPKWAIEELQHLSDNNRLQVIVESHYAHDKFIQNGIYNASIMRPIPIIEKKIEEFKTSDEFVIGFASSPRNINQFESRGIQILEKLAETFTCNRILLIAWRDEDVEISAILKESENVRIIYGYTDMSDFYSSIDMLIIPYTQSEDTHACSLSAIEAVSLGIPVLSTNISGVSEVIKKIDHNCIAENNWHSCLDKINYISENYKEVAKSFKAYQIDDSSPLSEIEKKYRSLSEHKIIALNEWKWALEKNGKYLVKGNNSIKTYYESQEIVVNYDTDRFVEYPMSVVNRIEQMLVYNLVGEYGKFRELKIIDIATGTGRILDSLHSLGDCTVIDNSQEMLKIILERYGKKINILKGDFFDMVLSSTYDVVTSFRYIRHFEAIERNTLMIKINKITKLGGIFIFDVPNIEAELQLRQKIGWQHFNIYDVFWNKASIENELMRYGFKLIELLPIDGYLFKEYLNDYRDTPISWVACAEKIEDFE